MKNYLLVSCLFVVFAGGCGAPPPADPAQVEAIQKRTEARQAIIKESEEALRIKEAQGVGADGGALAPK